MLPLATLLGFCLAVIPITVTPGASFSLVSARGLAGDHRGAWATILGTGLGIFTHGLLAGLGLAVVVMQSAQLYGAIRLVGACYLVGLGLMFLWNARRRGGADTAAEAAPPAQLGRSVRQAYVAHQAVGLPLRRPGMAPPRRGARRARTRRPRHPDQRPARVNSGAAPGMETSPDQHDPQERTSCTTMTGWP